MGRDLVIAFILAISSPGFAAKLISMGVGQVRDHIVTSREVKIQQAVDAAAIGNSKKKITWEEDVDSAAFAKQVTAAMLEWVVYLEAKSVGVVSVTSAEVSQLEKRIRDVLLKNEKWKALKVSERELSDAVERKLVAKKFIRFRADSAVVTVTDTEAQKYFEQNRAKFGALPFENFKTEIKSFLSRQQVEKRLRDWFEVLRAKYQVRNFLAEI